MIDRVKLAKHLYFALKIKSILCRQESCSVHLEDNDNSRYDPQTHLLYSNDTISDVVDCKVRVRQVR